MGVRPWEDGDRRMGCCASARRSSSWDSALRSSSVGPSRYEGRLMTLDPGPRRSTPRTRDRVTGTSLVRSGDPRTLTACPVPPVATTGLAPGWARSTMTRRSAAVRLGKGFTGDPEAHRLLHRSLDARCHPGPPVECATREPVSLSLARRPGSSPLLHGSRSTRRLRRPSARSAALLPSRPSPGWP